jgi:hypothetical protein
MPFRILSTALVNSVAIHVEKYCSDRYGKNGFKIESGLDPKVNWAPTLQFRPTKYQINAVEVSEDLYPLILKISAHDLRQECPDIPIAVYVACPLDSYLADSKQTTVRKLKEHGFGLFTVDDTGHVTEQFGAISLIHHIADSDIQAGLKKLPSNVRVKFKDAFEVYKRSSNQGLQDSGQIVEGLIFCLARHCEKVGWITPIKRSSAAEVVDMLYESTNNRLNQQRAALGRSRYFMKNFRNMASHPPKNIKESAQRIKRGREGFLDSLTTCNELCLALKALGFPAKLHIPG